MKYKKIILVILISFYVILFIVFSFLKKENIVLIGNSIIKLDGHNIIVNYDNKNINITSAKIYFNDKLINGYIESTGDNDQINQFSIYNSDGILLVPNKSIIAYIGDYDISIAKPNTSNLTMSNDTVMLNNIKLENNIQGDLYEFNKIIYDLNNDNIDDTLYVAQLYDTENEKIVSLTYVLVNDQVQLINKIEGDYNSPNCQLDFFDYLIDFNDDNNYEIVIKRHNGDDSPDYEIIYELQAGEYVEIEEE